MIFGSGNCTIGITLPDVLRDDPVLSNLGNTKRKAKRHVKLEVLAENDGSFSIRFGTTKIERGLKRGALLRRVLQLLDENFGAATLNASAVAMNGSTALIVGHGKTSMAAWLIEKGFLYVADRKLVIGPELQGLAEPLQFTSEAAQHLASLADFGSAPMVKLGERFYIAPKPQWLVHGPLKAGIIIFLNYSEGADLRLEKIYATDAVALMQKDQTGMSEAALAELASYTPTITLTYSGFEQLSGVLDLLLQLTLTQTLSPVAFEKFVSFMPQNPAPATTKPPIPARSDRIIKCKLSIGMATFDDYDGVYFSLQAIRLYHPEILGDVEFIIIDNNPQGPCGEELKKLEGPIPNLRYIPAGDIVGSTIKDRVFTEATGEYVLCMDCHVMFVPGSLKKLLDYFEKNPATSNLLQGPLVYDDLKTIGTHWNTEKWSAGMLGKWDSAKQDTRPDDPPFEIEAQGMGVFACRRSAWPGFNKLFRGFGGEEVYIHGKFRQRGDKTLCLPFLRWLHRFGRPMGTKYPNRWEDRIRNGLIGYDELGWDTIVMVEHFHEILGRDIVDPIVTEICHEFGWNPESIIPAVTAARPKRSSARTKASVIMPAFNSEKYIAETIESILNQSHSNFEFIIVNDGSTDSTADIAKKYAKHDKRVKLIHQKNQGEPAAVNAAYAASRFDLIARIDSDDRARPERLARQIEFMNEHDDIAVVGGYMQYIDQHGKSFGEIVKYPITSEACHASIQNALAGPIGNPAAMIRKVVFEKLGGYRLNFFVASDLDFWLRTDEHFKMANIPEVLLDYRWHGQNASAKKRYRLMLDAEIARQAARVRRKGLPDPLAHGSENGLAKLAALCVGQPDRESIFKSLHQIALSNHANTKEPYLLHEAEQCLTLAKMAAAV